MCLYYSSHLFPFRSRFSHLFPFLLIAFGIEKCFECIFHDMNNICFFSKPYCGYYMRNLEKLKFEPALSWLNLLKMNINFLFLLKCNAVTIIWLLYYYTFFYKCKFWEVCEICSNKSCKYYYLHFLLRLYCETVNKLSGKV